MDEDEKLEREMMALKKAISYVPREKLEKILLFHYFVHPKDLNELLDVWKNTNTKIAEAIHSHIKGD